MKKEIQPTADLPVSILMDILSKLPDPSKCPTENTFFRFQKVISEPKPVNSKIDQEYDVTELIFQKGKVMGKDAWFLDHIIRTRTTVYLDDYR